MNRALAAVAFSILCLSTVSARAEEFTLSAEEQSVVDLTNAERKRAGLAELKPNARLFEAARKHAANMAKHNQIEHRLDGKSHTQRLDDAAYKWMAARENLAFNQRTAGEVLGDWMKSAHHKENILARDITEIGVGIASDAQGQLYYAQVFARPEK